MVVLTDAAFTTHRCTRWEGARSVRATIPLWLSE